MIVLKIIGLILLCILLLVIFLLLAICFAPVHYKAIGKYNKQYEVHVRVRWLLSILTIIVDLCSDSPLLIKGKLFGITIYNNQKPEKEEKPTKPKKVKKKRKSGKDDFYDNEEIYASEEDLADINEENKVIINSETPKEEKSAEYVEKNDKNFNSNNNFVNLTKETQIADNTMEESKKVNSILNNLKTFFGKIKYICKNIRYTIVRIYGKIKSIFGNIKYYIDLLNEEKTKIALNKCKKRMVRIWKNIKPRYFRINLHIGSEDPSTMGEIMGVWGMLYPIHEGNIVITPDFENEALDGDFKIKGHITLFVFLWTAYIYFFDKDIKEFRQHLKREVINHGR